MTMPLPTDGGLKRIAQVRTFEDATTAQAWQRAAGVRSTVLAEATARMLELARIKPGHRILVIGAGTGDEALDVAARVGPQGHVIATDASSAMIEEMRRVVDRARVRNVRCLLMDAQHLDFETESFDAVVARNVLQFVPDLLDCLLEVRRVLKPGTWLGATVWAAARRNPYRSGPLEVARALGLRPPPAAHLRIAMRLGVPGRLFRALHAAGLGQVTVERVAASAHYDGLSTAVKEAMDHPGTRQLVAMMPEGSERRFATSLMKRWRRYGDSAGITLPGEQLVGAGMR